MAFRRLEHGAYDSVIDSTLAELIAALPAAEARVFDEPLDEASAPAALARVVHERLVRTLKATRVVENGRRVDAQIALTNSLLQHLESQALRVTLPGIRLRCRVGDSRPSSRAPMALQSRARSRCQKSRFPRASCFCSEPQIVAPIHQRYWISLVMRTRNSDSMHGFARFSEELANRS